jgi:hypothetical protein
LNPPPIQFPLRFESPIQNLYNNTSYSHVGDEGNDIGVGMDDFLWDTQVVEGILLHAFQLKELGDDVDVVYTFSETLKSTSTTPLWSTRVKVYPNRDNNVVVQLENNVWYANHVFLDTFEVITIKSHNF